MIRTDPFTTRWATHTTPPALLRRMLGHAGQVQAVAFCPDGRRGLSAATDGTLILWDLATGAALTTLIGHAAPVTSLVIDPDGEMAFSGSVDGTIRCWHIDEGRSTHILKGHSGPVRSLQFTTQGALLSASDDQTLLLWNLSTHQPSYTWTGHTDRVVAVAGAPDGGWAISASDDRTLRLWSLDNGHTMWVIPYVGGYVTCLAVAADGSRFFTGSDDRLLRCWELETGTLLATWAGHTGGVRSIVASPDGERLYSVDNSGTLCQRRLADGRVEATIQAHLVPIPSLALSPDGRSLLTGSQDRSFALWDQERLAWPFHQGHDGSVTGLAATPDGRLLVSCGEDGQVRLWDTADGTLLDEMLWEANPLCSTVLPLGGGFIVGDGAGGLKKVALADGRFAGSAVQVGEQRGAVLEVAITQDGKWLVAALDTWAVVVWDLAAGERSHVLAGHRASVLALALSPTSTPGNVTLLSGDENGVLWVWNLSSGEGSLLADFTGTVVEPVAIETVAISPNGRQAGVGLDDGSVALLSFPDGALLRRWAAHGDWVAGLLFDQRGELLLSAGGDGYLSIWRTHDGELISKQAFGVAFTRLGLVGAGVLVLGDEEGGLRVLDYSSFYLEQSV